MEIEEAGIVDCRRWACKMQQKERHEIPYAGNVVIEETPRQKERGRWFGEEMLRGRKKSRRDRPSIDVENDRFRFERQLQLMT